MDPGAAAEHADVRNIRDATTEQFERGLPSKMFPRSAIEDVRRVGQGLSPESHGHTGMLKHGKSESSESLIHPLSFHWGRGGLETGDYMLGTFRAHVHLSHNVTGG